MIFTDTVECPYCEHDNDMTDGLTDLPDSLTFDTECEECEKEFEVEVEFYPDYSGNKIEYEECESCNRTVRDVCKKGRAFPWPKKSGKDILCRNCFFELCIEEREE